MGLQSNLVPCCVRLFTDIFVHSTSVLPDLFATERQIPNNFFLLLFLVLPSFPFFFGSILGQPQLSDKAGHKWLSSGRRLRQWVSQTCSGISTGIVQHHGQSLTTPCQGVLMAWDIPPRQMGRFLSFSNIMALGRWRCLYSRARTKPQALSAYVLK